MIWKLTGTDEVLNFESVTMLDALVLLKKAWKDVSSKTIENCFIHSGLSEGGFEPEDCVPLTHFLTHEAESQVIKEFVNFNEVVTTNKLLTDEEIVESVMQQEDREEEEEIEDGDMDNPPTADQALRNIRGLITYFRHAGNEEAIETLEKYEDSLEKTIFFSKTKQMKIDQYFKITNT